MSSREEETLALLPLLQKGDRQALGRAVELHLPLVQAMLRRVSVPAADREEAFQNGCIGLVLALKKFEPERGLRFSTYAVPYILGEIRRPYREGGSVHVSRALRDENRRLCLLQDRLCETLGRQATLLELAQEAGISCEEAALALGVSQDVLSLDAPISPDNPEPFVSLASSGATQDEALQHLLVQEVFSHLSDREAHLIYLRFFRDHTQQETARVLAVSQVQISRLEKKILQKLRDQLDPASVG